LSIYFFFFFGRYDYFLSPNGDGSFHSQWEDPRSNGFIELIDGEDDEED